MPLTEERRTACGAGQGDRQALVALVNGPSRYIAGWRARSALSLVALSAMTLGVCASSACGTDAERSEAASVERASEPRSAAGHPPIIDTHIHLYDTERPGGVSWPPRYDLRLYRPVLTKHFDPIAKANGVVGAVVVEASDEVKDNSWVLTHIKDKPNRYLGFVGQLPVGADEFPGLLARYANMKPFVGVRLRQRPGGKAFFRDAVWRDLNDLAHKGLTLDASLHNYSLADVVTIARKVPRLKILINHLGGALVTEALPGQDWVRAIKLAAAEPNVYCKISGIFGRVARWTVPKDVAFYQPMFDVVYRAFGEDRVIYGSDWPVCERGGTYEEQLRIIRGLIEPKGKRAVEKLFAENAIEFYSLNSKQARSAPRPVGSEPRTFHETLGQP